MRIHRYAPRALIDTGMRTTPGDTTSTTEVPEPVQPIDRPDARVVSSSSSDESCPTTRSCGAATMRTLTMRTAIAGQTMPSSSAPSSPAHTSPVTDGSATDGRSRPADEQQHRDRHAEDRGSQLRAHSAAPVTRDSVSDSARWRRIESGHRVLTAAFGGPAFGGPAVGVRVRGRHGRGTATWVSNQVSTSRAAVVSTRPATMTRWAYAPTNTACTSSGVT